MKKRAEIHVLGNSSISPSLNETKRLTGCKPIANKMGDACAFRLAR